MEILFVIDKNHVMANKFMEITTDLMAVQKTVTYSPHKQKAPQTEIVKEATCSHSTSQEYRWTFQRKEKRGAETTGVTAWRGMGSKAC